MSCCPENARGLWCPGPACGSRELPSFPSHSPPHPSSSRVSSLLSKPPVQQRHRGTEGNWILEAEGKGSCAPALVSESLSPLVSEFTSPLGPEFMSTPCVRVHVNPWGWFANFSFLSLNVLQTLTSLSFSGNPSILLLSQRAHLNLGFAMSDVWI